MLGLVLADVHHANEAAPYAFIFAAYVIEEQFRQFTVLMVPAKDEREIGPPLLGPYRF
ncbi:hypothetical protein StoSoilA2_29140 [Arthrobacter sp. StoSoilA2]|nr:hypothetical protein StoSoilA2_29140 [Arthrobacter sp. StoSoilA2]